MVPTPAWHMLHDITIAVACAGERSHDETGSQTQISEFRLALC